MQQLFLHAVWSCCCALTGWPPHSLTPRRCMMPPGRTAASAGAEMAPPALASRQAWARSTHAPPPLMASSRPLPPLRCWLAREGPQKPGSGTGMITRRLGPSIWPRSTPPIASAPQSQRQRLCPSQRRCHSRHGPRPAPACSGARWSMLSVAAGAGRTGFGTGSSGKPSYCRECSSAETSHCLHGWRALEAHAGMPQAAVLGAPRPSVNYRPIAA